MSLRLPFYNVTTDVIYESVHLSTYASYHIIRLKVGTAGPGIIQDLKENTLFLRFQWNESYQAYMVKEIDIMSPGRTYYFLNGDVILIINEAVT